MKKAKRCLLIFVRRPELGKVKTRLAAEVGDQKALDIYKRLLAHTQEVSQKVDCVRHLWYVDQIVQDDSWSTDHFRKYVQVEGDLGARMKAAFAEALKDHDQVIIVGSDCPQLSEEIVEQAFDSLSQSDTVIGPTFDGGYYLLGMKDLHADLFDDMKWSVDDVCTVTKQRINNLSLTVTELPRLSDIDYKEDWDKYGLD